MDYKVIRSTNSETLTHHLKKWSEVFTTKIINYSTATNDKGEIEYSVLVETGGLTEKGQEVAEEVLSEVVNNVYSAFMEFYKEGMR